MTQLTLADALRLPAFRRADPTIVAARSSMERTIRWAHATEQSDVVPLLRPGDLVLTMGTGLPDDDDVSGYDRFASALADAASSGLVVELGRRWQTSVPQALVDACEHHEIPLVVLAHETRFAALTQALGEQIVDAQLAELLDAQRVHDTFTELSFEQAGPSEILDAVCRLTHGPVVVENSQHRPVDFLTGPASNTGFLDNWQVRSGGVKLSHRTGWDEKNGWLVTRLGSKDRNWGRLVVSSPSEPTQRLVAVVERAAAALALHRLHDRDRDNLVRRTHFELIAALQSTPSSPETIDRCELAGFPIHRRNFLGLVVRPFLTRKATEVTEVVATIVRAAHGMRTPALVCEVDREIRIVVSVPQRNSPDDVADRIAARVHAAHDVLIAAGRCAKGRDEIARSLLEAGQVADAVPLRTSLPPAGDDRVHRLEDLHLRGLIALFGGDERIRLFIDRELSPLREADASDGRSDLLSVLQALLEHPSSKTDAAASLHLSRAAFYDRLAKIERVLGVELDDPHVRTSLHFALLADELSPSD